MAVSVVAKRHLQFTQGDDGPLYVRLPVAGPYTGWEVVFAFAPTGAADPTFQKSTADGVVLNATTQQAEIPLSADESAACDAGGCDWNLRRTDAGNAGVLARGRLEVLPQIDNNGGSANPYDPAEQFAENAAVLAPYVTASMAQKSPARVATTANGTLATAFANGQTVDGVVLVTGNRILIKNQSTGSQNGLYVVAASGAPTRSDDADTGAELAGCVVAVLEGTANAATLWVCTNSTIVLGTTAVVFEAASGDATLTDAGIAAAAGAETAESLAEPMALSYALPDAAIIADGTTSSSTAINGQLTAIGAVTLPTVAPFTAYGARMPQLPPGPVVITRPLEMRDDYLGLSGASDVLGGTKLIARNFVGPSVVISPRTRSIDQIETAARLSATGTGASFVLGPNKPHLDLSAHRYILAPITIFGACGFEFFYRRTVTTADTTNPVIMAGEDFGIDHHGLKAALPGGPSFSPFGFLDLVNNGVAFTWANELYIVPGTVLTHDTTYYVRVHFAAGTVYLFVGPSPGTCALLHSAVAETQVAVENLVSRVLLGRYPSLAVGQHTGFRIHSLRFYTGARPTTSFASPTAEHDSTNSLLLLNGTAASLVAPFVVDTGAYPVPAYLYVQFPEDPSGVSADHCRIRNLTILAESGAGGILLDNAYRAGLSGVTTLNTAYRLMVAGAGSYSHDDIGGYAGGVAGVLLPFHGNTINFHIEGLRANFSGCGCYFGLACMGTVLNCDFAPAGPCVSTYYFRTDAVIIQTTILDDEGGGVTGQHTIIADGGGSDQIATRGVANLDGGQVLSTIPNRAVITCVGGGSAYLSGRVIFAPPATAPCIVSFTDAPAWLGVNMEAVNQDTSVPFTDHPEWMWSPSAARIAAASANPRTIRAVESGSTFTDAGSGAMHLNTLPPAAAGWHGWFYVANAHGKRMTAQVGDTIRQGATVTAGGGYVQSTAVGAMIHLQCLDATQWVVAGLGGAVPADLTLS